MLEQTDWSKVPRFWDDGGYLTGSDRFAIASFAVSENLMTPHAALAPDAAEAWRQDIYEAARTLEMDTYLRADQPEDGSTDLGYVPGPLDVELDYDKDAREYVFRVSSTLTDDRAEYRIAGRPITRMANDYRQDFVIGMSQMLRSGKPVAQSVITEMDRLRKGQHMAAAGVVQDALYGAGLAPRDAEDSKAIFTLLQNVAPMTNQVAVGMSELYEAAPKPAARDKPDWRP